MSATILQLRWDPPFTWPDFEIQHYTVTMENRSSGISADPVVLTPTDLTYTMITEAPVQHCAELRFNVTASNALGHSAAAVVTGGFPKGIGCSISRIIDLQFDTHLILKAANSNLIPVGTTHNVSTSLLN